MLSDLPKHLRHRRPADATRHGLIAEIELLSAAQSALDAYRCRVVAAIDNLGDKGLDAAEVLRSVGRVSGRAAARMSSTAARMRELPATAEALASGAITSGHADVIADAAGRVGASPADTELVAMACAAPADLFTKRAREWVAGRETDDDASKRHERHRRNRSVKSWIGRDGMKIWLAQLDPITAATVTSRLDAEYERLWRQDGGRDLTGAGAHITEPDSPDHETRTPQQRMADAFVSLLTATTSTGTGTTAAAGAAGPHVRQQMIGIVDLARMRTDDPNGLATLVDGTPLPQSVLEHLACISDITGVIFDGPGQPIWVGRTTRHATLAQWKALIVRDRGCAGCGADHNRCEAHHITVWNRGGPTDITNLVLVCSRCHHNIHDRGMRLDRGPNGWTITPRAGPQLAEIAA